MAKRESEDETLLINYPQKKFYRQRAHCNPLSFNDGFKYPLNPEDAKWELHYPNISEENRIIKFVDVGMGFGGLTVALGTSFLNFISYFSYLLTYIYSISKIISR